MRRCVLDASVAVKWYLPEATEPLSNEAISLFRSYAEGNLDILVPDLFFAEIGNIFWKAERLHRCTAQLGTAAVAALASAGFQSFGSSTLVPAALILARRYGRAVYDSIYVSLAVQESAPMITADEKLANAVAAYLPVRWLGAM